MKIAIDFEGTLIAECGEFPCEPVSDLARLFLPNGIRKGARTLVHELIRAGHTLTLYTSGKHQAVTLRLWCIANKLPIHHIITLEQCKKDVYGKASRVSWPPVSGQDLILDDEARHIETARVKGVLGLEITNHSTDWTVRVRETCLGGSISRGVGRPLETQGMSSSLSTS